MSDQVGEKTEQPTQRRLEEAWSHGQFARSAEVQTVFVLGGGFMALMFSGRDTWHALVDSTTGTLAHLHELPMTPAALQGYMAKCLMIVGQCVWPILAGTAVAGLLAGGMQSRFRTASEALQLNWARINPAEGFKRLFSMSSGQATLIGVLKLVVIIGLTYNVVVRILEDPIFLSPVDLSRISEFMAGSSMKIVVRILFALGVVATLDYAYQFWKTSQDLMMTREELKDEVKNSEGNQQVKGQMRRRRQGASQRKMLQEVPRADVIVTNPTHLAVALRYDRKTMRAPRVVAKGSRLNALRIREIARQHQVPIIENKPLARLMFKHARVGEEIPAAMYAAVAEVLAWVYRVNAYRYYREQTATT
ncbi:MAG: EscU/YscU/HrcU family type III secretion system export apparatus switch protein [Verrucomicrobiales bacterium]|nr:EscU/YscU/HrcU family type III secretion system export apparatus switch protein [Verrucomicrobiales bacterium]